jgi:aldehyde dehydrogenase (NAD+)
MPKTAHARNLIGGKFEAPRKDGLPVHDPATGRRVGTAPRSGAAEVDRAVAAAKAAFPAWADTPAPRRGEILFRAGEVLSARKTALGRLVTREMGKVREEAEGDVQEAVDMAYYVAGEGRRLFGHTTPSELPDKVAMTFREPLGVCGLVTPWNFPVAIPSWKAFPALVAGNTVVLKPSEETPGCATAFAECLVEAGLPPGVLNVVHGTGEEAGAPLVEHEDVPAVSFTGSGDTARKIAATAAPRFKRLHFEMGGKNGVVVLDDADLDFAVQAILWSAFGTSGQRCTAASRVIVTAGVHDALVERLVRGAKRLVVGPGSKDGVQVGPLVRPWALEKVERYVKIGVEEGARLRCGGRRAKGKDFDAGWFYEPTVFTDVRPSMRIAQEEIFGPVTAVIRVKDFDEAVEVHNGTPYGLSGAVITRDLAASLRAARRLRAGILYVHNGTIGAEVHLPFGGVKASGNGHREAGISGIDFFTETKTVYVDYSGRLQRAQIDTHGS